MRIAMIQEHTHPVLIAAEKHRRRWRNVFSRRLPGFDSLGGILDSFLSRGLDGAILKIKDKETGSSAEFRKYIVSEGQYGVEIRLKMTGEFKAKFREVEEFCAQIRITSQKADSTVPEEEHLTADFGKDLEKAHAVLVYFLADIHGLTPSSRFAIHWENVSPWNETIDSPGQEPLSDEEGIKLTKQQYRQSTGASLRSATLMGIGALVQIVGVAGVILSIIFQSDPAIIPSETAWFHFNPPTTGLIFMAMILIGFLAVFTDMYWLTPSKSHSGQLVPIPRTTKGAFSVFWGRPINWISVAVLVLAMIRWTSI